MDKCASQHLPERSARQDRLADELTEAQQGELTCSWAWAGSFGGERGEMGRAGVAPNTPPFWTLAQAIALLCARGTRCG